MGRRFGVGVLLTALLHGAIFWMFVQRQRLPEPVADGPRLAVQWLLPLPKRTAPASPPDAAPRRRPTPQASAPVQATPAPAQTRELAPADAAVAPPDPFAIAAPPASDTLAQARRDIGKIDQELRAKYPERPPAPASDSTQAKLERGFNAAHDAVPPKWYEGARITEISTPNSRTRTYRITTAVLTYCIVVTEEGRRNYINCPR